VTSSASRQARNPAPFRLVFERARRISIGRGGIMTETNPALQRMLGYSGSEFAGHYTR